MSLQVFIEDRFLNTAEKAANASGQPLVFDVAQIMQDLYGYKPVIIPDLPSTANTVTSKGSAIYGSKDLIGREVFCPVIIEAGGITYEFPFAVMDLKSKATIVETPIAERGGTVIEEIGVEAWKISIKGFLIDPLNQFPEEQLNMLNKVWKTRAPVRLKCALSDLFLEQDDHVVITSLTIPEKAKVIGVKDFSMEMTQATILDLNSIDDVQVQQ